MGDMSWTGQILLLVLLVPAGYYLLSRVIAPFMIWLDKHWTVSNFQCIDPPRNMWEEFADCKRAECYHADKHLWEKYASPEMKARYACISDENTKQRFKQEVMRQTYFTGGESFQYLRHIGALAGLVGQRRGYSPEYEKYLEHYLETHGVVTDRNVPPYLPPFNLDDYK